MQLPSPTPRRYHGNRRAATGWPTGMVNHDQDEIGVVHTYCHCYEISQAPSLHNCLKRIGPTSFLRRLCAPYCGCRVCVCVCAHRHQHVFAIACFVSTASQVFENERAGVCFKVTPCCVTLCINNHRPHKVEWCAAIKCDPTKVVVEAASHQIIVTNHA